MAPREAYFNPDGTVSLDLRAVSSEDCNTADEANVMDSETTPTPVPTPTANPCTGVDGGGSASKCASGGELGGGLVRIPMPPASPIVFDLDYGGFKFSSAADGVLFDITADGTIDQTAWIEAGCRDGFLVLDRNSNGVIDDATELFGNLTPQPPSDNPNGFAALAVFDAAAEGGDDDGSITAADRVFASLRVWIDRNHDGDSSDAELHPLSEYSIGEIELDPVVSMSQDRYGNVLRYRSEVRLVPHGVIHAVDVFFTTAGAASDP